MCTDLPVDSVTALTPAVLVVTSHHKIQERAGLGTNTVQRNRSSVRCLHLNKDHAALAACCHLTPTQSAVLYGWLEYLSLFVSACLHVCLSKWLHAWLLVCLFAHQLARLSVYLSVCLSAFLSRSIMFVCRSNRLFACLTIYLPACLLVLLFVWLNAVCMSELPNCLPVCLRV